MIPFRTSLISAGLLTLNAWAQAASPISAGITTSQLSYTATALDGATGNPSVSFAPGTALYSGDPYAQPAGSGGVTGGYLQYNVSTDQTQVSLSPVVSGAPFPDGNSNWTTSDGVGQLSTSAGTVTVGMSIDSSHVTPLWGDQGNTAVTFIGMSPDTPISAQLPATIWLVTVSAHTSVTFSGMVNYSMQFDADALNGLLGAAGLANSGTTAYASVGTQINSWALDGSTSDNSTVNDSLSYTFGDTGVLDLTQSGALSLSLVNNGDTDQVFGLSFVSVAGVATFVGDAVPTVPEPGTWALMGLGLVALGGVTRRRHARN